jgi:leader peptidase (prepilin peptidase)/N-methyltransferase
MSPIVIAHITQLIFVLALGACVGSFLNVVVWRLPRGESIISPPSHCPKCNTPLAWYDNIPVFGWLWLRGKCRYCKNPISPRYPIIEALTATLFAFYYVIFFLLHRGLGCPPMEPMPQFAHDWPIYFLYMWLISALLASSLIDIELFIIEPKVVWVTAAVAVLFHTLIAHTGMVGVLADIEPAPVALAAGGAVGLAISALLRLFGLFPLSFPQGEPILEAQREQIEEEYRQAISAGQQVHPLPPPYSSRQIRAEMRKEMLFLMPPLVLGAIWLLLTMPGRPCFVFWVHLHAHPWVRGLLGSLLGGMVGGFAIWLTRILGTLGFGRVGMGLGDADLMFAVGTVLGPGPAVVAFFLAPFFGILFALYTIMFRKHREIPYGPYLSLASAFVMVAYCPIAHWMSPGMQGLGTMLSNFISGK